MTYRDDGFAADLQAAEVISRFKINSLPVNPFDIADARGIVHQEKTSLAPGISGCLMKVGDAFGILYSNRFANEGFKRFNVSHELGHYFMPGHHGRPIWELGMDFINQRRALHQMTSMSAKPTPSPLAC